MSCEFMLTQCMVTIGLHILRVKNSPMCMHMTMILTVAMQIHCSVLVGSQLIT